MVSNHVYTIINTFCRDGRYSYLICNPWYANFARGYSIKDNRLSAYKHPPFYRMFPGSWAPPQAVGSKTNYQEIATCYDFDGPWTWNAPPFPSKVIGELLVVYLDKA